MDPNIILIVLVAVSATFTLLRIVITPALRTNFLWLYTSLTLLAILIPALLLAPNAAGYIAGAFWLLMYVIPAIGYRQLNRLVMQQRYDSALRMVEFLRFFQPFPGWTELIAAYRVMALAQRGEYKQASTILSRQRQGSSGMARLAKLQVYRMKADWEGLLEWVSTDKIPKDANILPLTIRALGETGRLDEMLALFEANATPLRQTRTLYQTAIFIFAFCGQEESLQRLLNGPLRLLPKDYKAFWLATAESTAGKRSAAEAYFRSLFETKDYTLRQAARRRLSNELPLVADQTTPEMTQAIGRIEQLVAQEERYGEQALGRSKTPYFTYVLIALNVAVFLVETANGDNTNVDILYNMKALWVPDVVMHGDLMRLLAPLFLHDGWAHLLLNMFALYVLGPYVEYVLGFLKTAIVYFGAGVGASILYVFLVQANIVPGELALGASGAIMGLLGATGAIMYRGWQLERTAVARDRLINVIVIVVLQVFLDAFVIQQSSLSAHLGGAILGYIIAILMPHHQGQQGQAQESSGSRAAPAEESARGGAS